MTSSFRPHTSLDGSWFFRTDPEALLTLDSPGAWRTLDVPGPWQAQAEDLRNYQGVAWYRRDFEIPPSWSTGQGSRVILHFGAVDDQAEVWVDRQLVGSHVGGYLPFAFDITAALSARTTHEIVVRVVDPTDDRGRWEVPFSEIPHGKQSWYGPLSGIWQSVWLEVCPRVHMEALRATPRVADRSVELAIQLNGTPSPQASVDVAILAPDGRVVAEAALALHGTEARGSLTLATIELWDLDQPNRYTAIATLRDGGLIDRMQARFGFRTIETRDGSLWLNGRPLMLRGALDQDYYPGQICTPPSYEFLVHQAALAKRMGLNCLRCHIKIADPRYLEAADQVGILVWAELPNWEHWTPAVGARGVATLQAAIERDWNHPSVVIWSVINESWGIDQSNPEHRAWLRSAFDQIKQCAGDRLVVDNSACFNNFHLKSDLDDYHFYAAMPDERERWSEWVRQFADRPRWSYGAELPPIVAGQERWLLGDAGYGDPLPEVERSGSEALIVSEFGNWGLPSLAELRGPAGRDPWWFETGDDWGDGVVYPHGVEQRAARLGLDRIFGSYEGFAKATRRAEFEALQFEIEAIRRHPSISGYVITEFTDVHWECNGLLDMRRNPKMPLDQLAALNADTVLILDREGGALRSGEQRSIEVAVSHWGAKVLDAVEVRVHILNASTGAPADALAEFRSLGNPPRIEPRTTTMLGSIAIAAVVTSATLLELDVELWAQGQRQAATSLRLAIYPTIAANARMYVADPALAARLSALGYQIETSPGDYPTIATTFDATLRERVLGGERVILLAEHPGAITAPLGPLQLRARAGTPWQGSWASSFSWMAGSWPGDGILDDSFVRVMPQLVITGFSQQRFPHSVASGLCVGWIQKPVALTGTQHLGRGQVTVTTFRIAEQLGHDPVADMILAQLLQ
ncbi:MAG: hypothetical protein Fur005_42830 [Roseiflexaceae bacterium]